MVIDAKDVVIRFAGDSGDGMQLTGSLFADMSAIFGNSLSTFPDYPAEIRAPQGTVSGVSGFQVHIGSEQITTPGDFCDLLVAMNPAALKANAKWLKRTAMVLLDSDTFDQNGLSKAGLGEDPISELHIEDRVIIAAPITALTAESLKDSGLDRKTIAKANGIGPKTAARVILELKDKLLKETDLSAAADDTVAVAVQTPVASSKMRDAQDALLVLGYSKADVQRALSTIDTQSLEVSEIIKKALTKLF